jgi:hypothetical protein
VRELLRVWEIHPGPAGYPHQDIVSDAGHDARASTAMAVGLSASAVSGIGIGRSHIPFSVL